MDEVDNIIIDSLKALNCDIPEGINNLKQFNDDLVILSVSTCLEKIIPSSIFPKKLSPSMAVRLKAASHLAEQIKDIGFKDEIGYQTLLYFNEVEIRRLLIFLIEKLPRDSETSIQTEEVGYISKLLIDLELKLKHFPSLWVSSNDLNRGVNLCEDVIEVRSYGNSSNMRVKNLKISSDGNNSGDRDYFIHILPTVTKQCAPHELIPSLLFDDLKFNRKSKQLLNFLKNIPIISKKDNVDTTISNNVSEVKRKIEENTNKIKMETVENVLPEKINIIKEDSVQSLSEELKHEEENYIKLKKIIDSKEELLYKLKEKENEEMKALNDINNQLNIKTKTMAVLSQEENLQKLKLLVAKISSRLVDLSRQWKEVQEPLLEEYNTLQSSLSEKESILQEEGNKLKIAIFNYEELFNELKNKVELEKKLVEKHRQCPKNTNRSTYTKNIMEIIGNIKKQNHEMQKILKDTREVQKDINTLTGQIDRSFTISDELIFSNAKKDETSKKAYMLLVSLHNMCGEIVKVVSDIGFIERECRNLQELIDIEISKETSVKLKRVNDDLQKIKEENIALLKQVQ